MLTTRPPCTLNVKGPSSAVEKTGPAGRLVGVGVGWGGVGWGRVGWGRVGQGR